LPGDARERTSIFNKPSQDTRPTLRCLEHENASMVSITNSLSRELRFFYLVLLLTTPLDRILQTRLDTWIIAKLRTQESYEEHILRTGDRESDILDSLLT
jgi:hypothetical protein